MKYLIIVLTAFMTWNVFAMLSSSPSSFLELRPFVFNAPRPSPFAEPRYVSSLPNPSFKRTREELPMDENAFKKPKFGKIKVSVKSLYDCLPPSVIGDDIDWDEIIGKEEEKALLALECESDSEEETCVPTLMEVLDKSPQSKNIETERDSFISPCAFYLESSKESKQEKNQ
jgi:hypothetical protein